MMAKTEGRFVQVVRKRTADLRRLARLRAEGHMLSRTTHTWIRRACRTHVVASRIAGEPVGAAAVCRVGEGRVTPSLARMFSDSAEGPRGKTIGSPSKQTPQVWPLACSSRQPKQ
jgi:hypothetical protein